MHIWTQADTVLLALGSNSFEMARTREKLRTTQSEGQPAQNQAQWHAMSCHAVLLQLTDLFRREHAKFMTFARVPEPERTMELRSMTTADKRHRD